VERTEKKIKDPVCGMQVDPHQHAIEYQRVPFAFCSRQCKDRFLANPHLYIGFPGQKAPKQEGRTVLKHRRLHLARELSSDEAAQVSQALSAMMGIKEVKVSGKTLDISYDLLEVTAQQIEERLGEIGVQLGEGWAEHLRRAFVHESEELQIESMEVTPPHHY